MIIHRHTLDGVEQFVEILARTFVLHGIILQIFRSDAALADDTGRERVGIHLVHTLTKTCNQIAEGFQLRGRGTAQSQTVSRGLVHHLPERHLVLGGCGNQFAFGGFANTARGKIDDTPQGLVVVGIAYHADVGKRIADFSTLVEGQTAMNMVGYIRETHCLL